MLTAAQMRAARALVGMEQRALAEASGVSLRLAPPTGALACIWPNTSMDGSEVKARAISALAFACRECHIVENEVSWEKKWPV